MLIRAKDAPQFDDDAGTIAIGYASPSRGASETSVWRVSLEPGCESPVHRLEQEEVFMALAGTAVATVAGKDHQVGPDDCLIVDPGVDFQIRSTGEQPFRAVGCMPAGATVSTADGGVFVPPWAS